MPGRNSEVRFFLLLLLLLSGTGCAGLNEPAPVIGISKEIRDQHELYAPYEKQDTVEGYKEFLARYPGSVWCSAARTRIEEMQFKPYQETNSLAGYREYIAKYPNNANVSQAFRAIEELELIEYEERNTLSGYQEFIAKYPSSHAAVKAKELLTELDLKRFDKELRESYGFDLLLYRLNLRRLQHSLDARNRTDLADFSVHADFTTIEGKKYFHTQITFHDGAVMQLLSSAAGSADIFDLIISRQLKYLFIKFKKKEKVDGFGFDIALLPEASNGERKVFCEYYFPMEAVRSFSMVSQNKTELMERSIVVSHFNK